MEPYRRPREIRPGDWRLEAPTEDTFDGRVQWGLPEHLAQHMGGSRLKVLESVLPGRSLETFPYAVEWEVE